METRILVPAPAPSVMALPVAAPLSIILSMTTLPGKVVPLGNLPLK
jgi:hypothetical protein